MVKKIKFQSKITNIDKKNNEFGEKDCFFLLQQLVISNLIFMQIKSVFEEYQTELINRFEQTHLTSFH